MNANNNQLEDEAATDTSDGTTSEMNAMLSVQGVATRLSVSKASVYRLIESGLLTAHRIGVGRGTIRVSPEAIEEYLLSSLVAPLPHQTECKDETLKHIRW